MARPKSVTLKLTPKQREMLKKLTGSDHTEVKFEATQATLGGKSLAAKSAPSGQFIKTPYDLKTN